MRQVFYIEADEEMISVIGRVRKSSASENIIVAPHRSLILQSIVNLRLLSHDARKNGKEIIVVTQDAQSRSLCEKAGIQTQVALDEDYAPEPMTQYSGTAPVSQVPTPQPAYSPQMASQPSSQENTAHEKSTGAYLPFSDALGTTDFYGNDSHTPPQLEQELPRLQQPTMESLSKPQYGDIRQVTVRDQNPKKLTTLNSQRFEEERLLSQQKSFTPPSLRGAQPGRPLFTPPQMPPAASFSGAVMPPQAQQSGHPLGFLEQHRKSELTMPVAAPPKIPEKQVVVTGGGKMRAFFIFFGLISILSVAGVGAFLFLPKANVHVKLKVMTQKADFEFDGSTKATEYSAESKVIPVRMIEKDQEITRSFDATGKASLADQKARGSVIIYNEFSVDKQPLVASTRLLSSDGKVFRLLSGVTIPGMTTVDGKIEPGAIEAVITADQPGQDYNVAPTIFTIPGFEGSPKYAKFSAKSSVALSGGGMSGSDALAVSDQDIAKAKKAVELEVKDVAEDVVNQGLEPGEKILSETIDTAIVSSSASPQSGAVTDAFDYRVKIHVRAFVFSEDDLKKMVSTLFAKQNTIKGALLSPSAIDLQYGEPTENFSLGTLRISVHAVGRSESGLDEAQLKSDLLGQNESDIAALLQKYTQIDSISIDLSPEFITSRVPARAERVTISIESLDGEARK